MHILSTIGRCAHLPQAQCWCCLGCCCQPPGLMKPRVLMLCACASPAAFWAAEPSAWSAPAGESILQEHIIPCHPLRALPGLKWPHALQPCLNAVSLPTVFPPSHPTSPGVKVMSNVAHA